MQRQHYTGNTHKSVNLAEASITPPNKKEVVGLHEKIVTALDFSAVTHTMQRENPLLTIGECRDSIFALSQWLSITPYAAEQGKPLQMLKSVDVAWHALILNTKLYRKVCEEIGFFVDHDPVEADKPNILKDDYAKFTLWALNKTFGDKTSLLFSDLTQNVTCCFFENPLRGSDGKLKGCLGA